MFVIFYLLAGLSLAASVIAALALGNGLIWVAVGVTGALSMLAAGRIVQMLEQIVETTGELLRHIYMQRDELKDRHGQIEAHLQVLTGWLRRQERAEGSASKP